jgi:hypothetical protein
MSFKYYHDAGKKVVYRMPAEPTVIEQKDSEGRRTGWTVQSEIGITRANNAPIPTSHQWKYRLHENPQEYYDAKDSRADVVGFFNTQHVPNCLEIDHDTYDKLRKEYENEARQNKNT